MDNDNSNNDDQDSAASLETIDTQPQSGQPTAPATEETVQASPDNDTLAAPPGDSGAPELQARKKRNLFRQPNTYLFGFIILMLIAVGLAIWTLTRNGHTSSNSGATPASQTLSPKALQQLAASDSTIGGPKQVLTVQSNAVLAGQVLIKRGLQVAGDLQIGGNLSIPSLAVSGASQFGSAQVNNNLQVAGNTTVQGQLAIQQSLTTKGGGTFGGPVTAPQISANSLLLNGDLTLTHHISAGGGTPSRSYGSAIGSGGSASVSGSDTAGTVDIDTGNSPSAGCFVTINFVNPFSVAPHIVITPVGAGTAGLDYYINRTARNFQVCASNPSANTSYTFDYIAFD